MSRLAEGLLRSTPWAVPSLLVVLLSARFIAPMAARRGRIAAAEMGLLWVSFGLIATFTLTPSIDGFGGRPVPQPCALGLAAPRWFSSSLFSYPTDRDLNVLLFMPLGVAVGLLPDRRSRAVGLVGSVLLSIGVEGVQRYVPWLGRTCDSRDVTDNVTGLLLGFALAVCAVTIVRRGRRRIGSEGAAEERR